MRPDDTHILLHATTVALNGRAVLLTGASGAGKSSLALRLITLGAWLVADDQTLLSVQGHRLIAKSPDTIAGMIEARGVGLLRAPVSPPAEVMFAVDLEQEESKRLPDPHHFKALGITLPCLHRIDQPHFPDAILLCLREGIFPTA